MTIEYHNRYVFTDHGPAMIVSREKLSATQPRRIFADNGLTVERIVRNWFAFLGWPNVIELANPREAPLGGPVS